MPEWRVLIVEDDMAVSRYHEVLVAQTPGFSVVGVVDTAEAAALMAQRCLPDLLLLDLALPGRDGVALLRELRGRRQPVEAITISARRNAATVRECAHLGVVDYLVKPVPPDRLRQSLRLFVNRMSAATRGTELEQAQIDLLTASGRIARRTVPKGLDQDRVQEVRAALRDTDLFQCAHDVSLRIGMSRVTVRRYLEFLAVTGEAESALLPGTTGRPRKGYRLRASRTPPAARA